MKGMLVNNIFFLLYFVTFRVCMSFNPVFFNLTFKLSLSYGISKAGVLNIQPASKPLQGCCPVHEQLDLIGFLFWGGCCAASTSQPAFPQSLSCSLLFSVVRLGGKEQEIAPGRKENKVTESVVSLRIASMHTQSSCMLVPFH